MCTREFGLDRIVYNFSFLISTLFTSFDVRGCVVIELYWFEKGITFAHWESLALNL